MTHAYKLVRPNVPQGYTLLGDWCRKHRLDIGWISDLAHMNRIPVIKIGSWYCIKDDTPVKPLREQRQRIDARREKMAAKRKAEKRVKAPNARLAYRAAQKLLT